MKTLSFFLCLMALFVIVLGAYTRLSDAGLGCPDWPLCYGHLTVPKDSQVIQQVQTAYQQPLEIKKAWTEMIHRYVASGLGLGILILAFLAFKQKQKTGKLLVLPFIIIGVVVLQGLLGMWTVTLKLLPPIILLHLLGGLTILSLLWWLSLSQTHIKEHTSRELKLRPWIILGILLLLTQIALGGWTSANYAALICPDFPYCQGELLPTMKFDALIHSQGISHDNTELITIHMAHRIGALITGCYLLLLAMITLFRYQRHSIKVNAMVIIGLLLTQITLGILNIIWLLPMSTAVTHNLVAALLLLSLITLLKLATAPRRTVFYT